MARQRYSNFVIPATHQGTVHAWKLGYSSEADVKTLDLKLWHLELALGVSILVSTVAMILLGSAISSLPGRLKSVGFRV